ncbi:MAG: divalent-cation tolerance protein CutA [Thermoguttaceae bacterium]
MSDFIQVLTTTASQDEARQIAEVLVERRLAACVQISGPIGSVYRWQGRIESAEEWQCQIKTRQSLLDELSKAILELHPYQVPEIIAVPIVGGSRDYLEWLEKETGRE